MNYRSLQKLCLFVQMGSLVLALNNVMPNFFVGLSLFSLGANIACFLYILKESGK